MKRVRKFLVLLLLMSLLSGCNAPDLNADNDGTVDWEAIVDYGFEEADTDAVSEPETGLSDKWPEISYMGETLPAWDGESAWAEIHDNEPWFTDEEKACVVAFEAYSDLDSLGRCGQAYANICLEIMPDEERGGIGSVKPSGWHTVKYNGLVDGNYLYNRCHLIGYQLAGENANEKNLITGTRFLNIQGMLDLENQIADCARDNNMHVLYRVMPVFYGSELVCRGLVTEAFSVEDNGSLIKTCRFAWNAQPGIEIDYATGESRRADGMDEPDTGDGGKRDYVANTSSGKVHLPECRYAFGINPGNRLDVHESLAKLYASGYTGCGVCRPGGAD